MKSGGRIDVSSLMSKVFVFVFLRVENTRSIFEYMIDCVSSWDSTIRLSNKFPCDSICYTDITLLKYQ